MTSPEPRIVYATTGKESANEILEHIGVTTIREEDEPVKWYYEGKTVIRPDIKNWEDDLLEYFNIKLIYQDKNQLTLL